MLQAQKTRALLCTLIGPLLLAAVPAAAAELFGVQLFGEQHSPQVGSLRYEVVFSLEGGEAGLKKVLSESSLLVADEAQGAADAFALIARARADRDQLTAALYTQARYGGRVDILVAGRPLSDARPDEMSPTDNETVPVSIHVDAGPVFNFGNVAIDQTQATDAIEQPRPQDYGLTPGQPARSDLIVRAIDRLVEDWRSKGYPFAQVAEKEISADHARREVDVAIRIDPGAPAVYGWISVVGAKDLDSKTIADQSALEPGRRFDPRDLSKSRERLRKLESIESVRIIEGNDVDAGGGIPLTLEVRERKPRFFGGTASVSTLDGAEVNAYWGHRNLLGEGERLRVDGSVSRLGAVAFEDLEFDAGAIFEKPGIYDIDTDLFAEFRMGRDNPEPYDAYSVRLKTGVSHRFSEWTTGSVAIEAGQSRIEDAFGTRHHTLLSTPADIGYDGRDNRLDPASGLHAVGRLVPVVDVAEGGSFLAAEFQVAGYRSIDPDGRMILAGRVAGGSIAGASHSDVPASYRYFAGGGGSVRGYEYRSLGPLVDGRLAGGLSFVSASAELRLRVSEHFGVVPFVDVATVSENSFPEFSEANYVGAGLGLRYYTSLGPLRFDFAVPLTERDNRDEFAFYVGLGQAF